MPEISELLSENQNNHYRILTIVGNNQSKKESVKQFLKENGWTIYDVEEIVLNLIKDIPEDKIGVRIGTKLKEWVKEEEAEQKMVLDNTSILNSPEVGGIGAFSAFKYRTRALQDREAVLFLDGKLKGNKVVYSTPDKPDYNETELEDVIYTSIENVELGEK